MYAVDIGIQLFLEPLGDVCFEAPKFKLFEKTTGEFLANRLRFADA